MKRYMTTISAFAFATALSIGGYAAAQSSTTSPHNGQTPTPSSSSQVPCTPANGSSTSTGNSDRTPSNNAAAARLPATTKPTPDACRAIRTLACREK